MTPRQLQILQHSLGLDQYGRGEAYRNMFAGAEGKDAETCRELIALGYMRDVGSNSIYTGFNLVVTDAGKAAVRRESPKPPKLTRAQLRYERFLRWSDVCNGTFREFLEWEKQERAAQRYERTPAVASDSFGARGSGPATVGIAGRGWQSTGDAA